jgi:guanylate cyclase
MFSLAVYVFVGEHVALVDFVKVLHRRGLLDRGEYVVISVDDEIYDPESKHKIVQRGEFGCLFAPRAERKRRARAGRGGGGMTWTASSAPEYIDPFLRNGAASRAEDAVGFRSVLKLTPGHPREPQFK